MSRSSSTSHRRAGGFQPPHCPNPTCAFHAPRPDWSFVRNGAKTDRHGRPQQRFLCRHCRREFCARSFSTSYWLKKPHLLRPIAEHATEGNGIRQTARLLRTSHTTVMRHLARLGRHCLLTHRSLCSQIPIPEAIVFDGFESFAHSQYAPFHANLATGGDSWFLYHFTLSPLRRKGSMTAAQKARRTELEHRFGRPHPKAVENGIYTLLADILPRVANLPLHLHSDDHPAYRRALARLGREETLGSWIHGVTSSKKRRTSSNPLFPVNLADLLLRHGGANHRRETIAFSKRLQAAAERLAVFLVWRNYIKKRCEKDPVGNPETAAMRAGVIDRALTWREILKGRLFPSRLALPPEWEAIYRRSIPTPFAGCPQGRHNLRYAF